MTVVQQWITIGMVVLGTMATRFLPFLLFPSGKPTPPFVRYLGRFLPAAALGMLVADKPAWAPGTFGRRHCSWIAFMEKTNAAFDCRRHCLLHVACPVYFLKQFFPYQARP